MIPLDGCEYLDHSHCSVNGRKKKKKVRVSVQVVTCETRWNLIIIEKASIVETKIKVAIEAGEY